MRMKWISLLLVVVTLAATVGATSVLAAPEADDVIYVVQRGDTLYGIARRFGVDMMAIAQANGIVNPSRIYVGQRLVIPGGTPPSATPTATPTTPSQPSGGVHVVQPGDTLYRIALRYGVSVAAIVQANGISNPNMIRVGQQLVIPGGTPPSGTPTPTATPTATPTTPSQPSGGVHIVQPGDTLYRIALRYGVSVAAIVQANNISNPNMIRVGQQLVIPGAGAAPAPAPTPVPGGSVSGGFELGGQTHTLGNPDLMKRAGMTWVKYQIAWAPGMPASDVAGRIQAGHSQGFKVLLSVVGQSTYPSSIDFGGLVEFLRQVAQQGPDAIEIWNEPNIDREWPVGQISATSYVQHMLAPAYNAIKGVNPNILVISGAPAPTGWFGGGCSGAGCDDAPYMRAMAAAGAARYMDCIGVHYNEGILPPSQTSGDPRGNSSHYTRYFWGMLNTYSQAFGGQRKVCFTELGYVSPEGYGALPANFSWAADTSIAEQATWLAEAASLSASSGKVRLLIVYNVDFTSWTEHDPQAGYAIRRADGSCPACDSLGAVMK